MKEQHREASQLHRTQLSALQGRYTMLKRYTDEAYEDKLSGKISEELWREKNEKWQLERAEVKRKLIAIEDEEQDYIQKGIALIEPCVEKWKLAI